MMINYNLVKDNPITIGDKRFANVLDFIEFLSEDANILDRQERRYIKNIVRPFHKDVTYIIKHSMKDYYNDKIYEYITIEFDEVSGIDGKIHLPCFTPNTMYKGMIRDNRYTLEELGITFKN